MKFHSTKDADLSVTLSESLLTGAAPRGGLYYPDYFPQVAAADLHGLDMPARAARLLAGFFEGDALAPHLEEFCRAAFAWPVPLTPPQGDDDYWLLELFHGPTGAFKDHGARFLAAALDRLGDAENPFTVLVATSGDTGGAVGAAFENATNARAVILFPKGRVSPFQRHQLTCWGPNVTALEMDGDFDDCQRIVKQAFADEALARRLRLTSANSINLGRLMPQMAFFASAAADVADQTGQAPGFIIPTGNMGNGVACLWARACGLPIGEVIIAANANRTLPDYFEGGGFEPRAAVPTLANAMDIGNPSNFARFERDDALRPDVSATSVSDEEIERRITAEFENRGRVLCPHTAVAAEAFAQISASGKRRPWVAAATAHPYKFREIVEPLTGQSIAPPPALAAILDRETQVTPVAASFEAFVKTLESEK